MNPKGTYDKANHIEYEKLGKELDQTTCKAIARKFEIHYSAVTSLLRLDDDDIRLIREIMKERRRIMKRREELRQMLK